ncbi:MAG: hypothetical protein ACRYG7_11320 [Janthinobacterium lividum]
MRYAKAAKGQRLVLFLKKHPKALEIVDASTGEMSIVNEQVTLQHDSYDGHYGQSFVPYAIALPAFKAGLKKVVSCFKIPMDPSAAFLRTVVPLCGAEEVNTTSSANTFTGWLYRRIKSRYALARK